MNANSYTQIRKAPCKNQSGSNHDMQYFICQLEEDHIGYHTWTSEDGGEDVYWMDNGQFAVNPGFPLTDLIVETPPKPGVDIRIAALNATAHLYSTKHLPSQHELGRKIKFFEEYLTNGEI